MTMPETEKLKSGLNSLRDEFEVLKSSVSQSGAEVSALMSIVIQTHKAVSENLIKLTVAVSDINSIEKVNEDHQKWLNKLQEKTASNELALKLSIQNSDHIKDAVDEIKQNQRAAIKWASGIFGSIIIIAIVGGIVYAKS